jgi:hypothetical protein
MKIKGIELKLFFKSIEMKRENIFFIFFSILTNYTIR